MTDPREYEPYVPEWWIKEHYNNAAHSYPEPRDLTIGMFILYQVCRAFTWLDLGWHKGTNLDCARATDLNKPARPSISEAMDYMSGAMNKAAKEQREFYIAIRNIGRL